MIAMRVSAVAAFATAVCLAGGALAGTLPSALVEDVSGTVPGVEVMGYVEPGRTIALGSGQSLTLSYLRSCVNETITGGTVTVGDLESTVAGGKVSRAKMPCDGGGLLLAAGQSGKAGVTVFRDISIGLPDNLPRARITLFRTTPVVMTATPGTVHFERLDQPADPVAVAVAGRPVDLAAGSTALDAGGLYRVTFGEESVVIRVDKDAKAGGGPAMGRLIRF